MMKKLKHIILEILFENNNSLSYFQLRRKLANMKEHDLIPELTIVLNEILKENYIEEDSDLSEYRFYKITKQGREFVENNINEKDL